MNREVRQELVRLFPVVLFLTVALAGVMIISAYYVDANGLVSFSDRPGPAVYPSDEVRVDEEG